MPENKKQEMIGMSIVLLSAIFSGIYPVLIHVGTQTIPPLFFASITILSAAFFSLIYLLCRRKKPNFFDKRVYLPLVGVTLFIIIIPSILIFIGTRFTSGINTSFLMLAELLFTMIFTHFMGEKTSILKISGGLSIILGAGFLVHNGSFFLNWGDILIILGTSTYALGSLYGKRLLHVLSPEAIVFARSFLGGSFLLILSLIFETPFHAMSLIQANWLLLLANGFLAAFLSKIFWYQGLKRLDIFKATSLAMTFPIFSLLFLTLFYHEFISRYQWIGMAIMMMGVYFSVKRPSVDPRKTKYSPELMSLNG